MAHPDCIVLTPSYKGEIYHGRGCFSVCGCSVISTARHSTLAGALLRYPGQAFLWLDDDVIVTDEDIAEMFAVQDLTGAGAVTGWYPLRGEGKTKMSNNRRLGGYHGRWSEITSCGAGCLLVMPWVWEAFPRETWLWDPGPDGTGAECPPAFLSRPSWDRINTTEDFDFALNLQDLGVGLVAANLVSAHHGDKHVPVDALNAALERGSKLPSVDWCRDRELAKSSQSAVVVISDEHPEQSFLDAVSSWCVDFGHPCFSPRFGKAIASTGEVITTPMLARNEDPGLWTISYPKAKRIHSPAGSPSCNSLGRAEPAPISERTAI
jgi:hypothetical protein